jgi:ATP-dependent DNA helicase RecG
VVWRKHCAAQAFDETIPAQHLPATAGAWRRRLQFCTTHRPDVSMAQLEDQTHPAWQRLKAEELLAQQLSQLQAKRERQLLNAAAARAQHQPQGVLAQLQARVAVCN